MGEIFFDEKSGNYFMQPQQQKGYGYTPFQMAGMGWGGGIGRMGWGMNYRQPMMPLQNFGKSMVAELTANQYKGGGAPSLASLFPGLSSPQSYSFQNQSYAQPSESSGAGRFTGLLGGK